MLDRLAAGNPSVPGGDGRHEPLRGRRTSARACARQDGGRRDRRRRGDGSEPSATSSTRRRKGSRPRSSSSRARSSTSTRRHQLRRILFEKLELVPQKRTKTGYSTDAQSLARLRDAHPLVDTLLRYREVEKLRSTYGEGLLPRSRPTGGSMPRSIRPSPAPGRLSSDQPNLHNIPVRSLIGRRFREAFVPAQDRSC